MIRFIMKIFVLLFAVTLWQAGILGPLTSDLGGQVSIAEAGHVPEHPRKCGPDDNPKHCPPLPPPTVSEFPIKYMVLSGAVLIALSGGMVFYIRKRKMKSSLEV